MNFEQNTPPEVSIIICAYNSAAYVAETLDSVLAQTYQDYEIVLVNDGSTDNLEEILRPYFDKIVYVKQENKGLSGARNTGLRHARGTYIALLDSDDLWLPNYLEVMVGLLEANPDVDLYYPNAELFGDSHLNGQIFQTLYPSSLPITVDKLLSRECNVFISAIFKRTILDKVGNFDEELRSAEDLDLWLRMVLAGYTFKFTPQILARYRKRADSLSAGSTRFFQMVVLAMRKFQSRAGVTKAQHELAEKFIVAQETEIELIHSKQALLARNYRQSLQHLLKVIYRRPRLKLMLIALGLLVAPQFIFRVMTKREGIEAGTPA